MKNKAYQSDRVEGEQKVEERNVKAEVYTLCEKNKRKMTSHSIQPMGWSALDDNYYERGRPRSAQHHTTATQNTRPRPRSADDRPQYNSGIRRNGPYREFSTPSYSETPAYSETASRYPSFPARGVYDDGEWERGGQQPHLSTAEELIMVPGDPYNSTVRTRNTESWGDYDNYRWQQQEDQMTVEQQYMQRQQVVPHIPSASFPDGRSQHYQSSSFPKYGLGGDDTDLGSQGKGWRSSMMKSSMAKKLKGIKSTIMPTSSRDDGFKDNQKGNNKQPRKASSNSSRGGFSNWHQEPRTQDIFSQDHHQSRSYDTFSKGQNMNRERAGMQKGGSFDNDFDFDGDGFAHSKTTNNDYDNQHSHGFKVIQSSSQSTASNRVKKAGQYQSRRNDQNALRNPPISFSQYRSNSKISRLDHNLLSEESPTSIIDLNPKGVQWSENLSQSPSYNRKMYGARGPKSILRSSRLNRSISSYDYPSVDTPPKAQFTKIQGQYTSDTNISIDFVDGYGNSLSPIRNANAGSPDGKIKKKYPEVNSKWMDMKSGFEKHIPEEYQRPFRETKMAGTLQNDSDVISEAYDEFIESVASVVVQTAVRQFLAKARVRRIRLELAAARKFRLNRKRIEGQRRSSSRGFVRSTGNRVGLSIRHENQLFHLAAIRIQSVFRGWWVRDSIKVLQSSQWHAQDHYDLAATIIQAQWRCFSTEMRFLRMYRDILIIQSVVRGWITRKIVNSLMKQKNELYSNRLRSQHTYRRRLAHKKSPPDVQNINERTQFQPTSSQQRNSYGLNNSTRERKENQQNTKGFGSKIGADAVNQRRQAKEAERQARFEEDRRRQEKEAAQADEVKAMQRRMGVRSPGGKIPSGNQSIHRTSEPARTTGREARQVGMKPSGPFDDSDRETEVQSNRSSSSHLFKGWRDKERSNNLERKSVGSNNLLRIKEIENQEKSHRQSNYESQRLSDTSTRVTESRAVEISETSAPIQKQNGGVAHRLTVSRSPRTSGISIQDVMRSQRSNSEQSRINNMHGTFSRVGLMAKFDDDIQTQKKESSVMQESRRERTSLASSQAKSFGSTTSHIETERRDVNAKVIEAQEKPFGIQSNLEKVVPSRTDKAEQASKQRRSFGNVKNMLDRFNMKPTNSTIPSRIDRKLFAQDDKKQAKPFAKTNQMSKNFLTSGSEQSDEKQRRLMKAFGLDTSNDTSNDSDDDSDSFDIKEEALPVIPPISRGARIATKSSRVSSHTLLPDHAHQASVMQQNPQIVTTFQSNKPEQRFQSEQNRINEMHEIFSRVGLMKRATKSR